MTPLVSVIIPTYNRADLLPAAIESVIGQTFSDWELIVVDDGSTDNTAEMIRPLLLETRLRYVPEPNRGRSAARNYGASLALGQWLIFLDSDDCFLPNTLTAHLATVNEQPGIAMTIGGYEFIDGHGHRLGERRPWEESSLALPNWVFNSFGMPGAVMIQRHWFQQVLGFDETLHMSEDWDLFLRLAQAGGTMGWTRAMVCQYRQHAGNSIHDLALHRDSSLRVLDKFFGQPGLAPALANLAQPARAWVYVIFARRAFASGYGDSAGQDLRQALALDPALANERRPQLLETLFTPEAVGQESQTDMAAAVMPYLPPKLRHPRSAVRRARARAHMARFFHAQAGGTPAAAMTHLGAGLRLDPRWLLNGGVAAYFVRRILRRPSGSGSQ